MPVFYELFPILATPDVARALRFYRDQLGGTVTYQFPEAREGSQHDRPEDGDPAYVSVRIGASAVGITGQTEPETTANDRISLWLYTEDCDAAIAHLRAGGVTVVQEPQDQPWGERMAIVLDPDSNRVHVAAHPVV